MRIELRKEMIKSPGDHPENDFAPYLDTFLLDGAKQPLGAVLVLPGGGYTHRALHEGDPVAKKFNALGFHAFVLQYRVAPYTAPAPQLDVIRAIKIIRANAATWGITKLAVLGFSAGAHLAASGVLMADKFTENNDETDALSAAADALILCYPVISLTAPFAHRGSGTALTGGQDIAAMKPYDLQNLVSEATPPAFLWHTADDACVSVRNSLAFAEAMWQCGNTCEMHIFPHAPHGRGLGYGYYDIVQWPELAAKFLTVSAGFPRA